MIRDVNKYQRMGIFVVKQDISLGKHTKARAARQKLVYCIEIPWSDYLFHLEI